MDNQLARETMIDQQVRTWEVLDPAVLEVMAEMPRERFVPESHRSLAFADTSIPIGFGQVMLPPKVEGRLLQAVALQRGERVLEVGTGTGYLSACLAALGADLVSVEIHEQLAQDARRNLDAVGIPNVNLRHADGTRIGEKDRYDVIALTGSLPVYDQRFERALHTGGRLFVVIGEAPVMEAMLVTRTADNDWVRESLFETVIPPLENVVRPAPFRF